MRGARVLVAGATGFLGVPLVRELLKRGHAVTVLTREPSHARAVLPSACAAVQWDPGGTGLAPPGIDSTDVIVNLAGEPVADGRWTPEKKRRILDSRVRTTRALAQAAASERGANVKAFISASAIGIYGDRGDDTVDETTPPGTGFLPTVCQAWEAEAAVAGTRARLAILRIGIVLGRSGGAFAQLYPLFKSGLGGRVGSGAQWFSWIHLTDAVNLFTDAVEQENYRGIYNVTAPEPVTNADFSHALAKAVSRPCLLPVPAFALRALLGEKASIVLEGARVLPRRALENGFKHRFSALPEALAELVSQTHPKTG